MPQDNTPRITVYARTDVGMVRAGNEDTFLVLNLNTSDTWTPVTVEGNPPDSLTSFVQGERGTVLAVSDGMGGALAGEVASRMAVEGVRDRMLQFQSSALYSPFPFTERLRLAVEQANIHINNESLGNAEFAGMGATFTAAGVHDGCLVLAQIGDSRCYLIRDGHIHLLTHDQSLVWQLVEAGHITEEEAETHQYKNVILQALGAQPRVNVVVDRVKLSEGDTILLCSDGLSGRVRAEEMLQIVTSAQTLRAGCEGLIQLANERGGDDNITVVLARFNTGELPPPTALECDRLERDPDLPYEVEPGDADADATIQFGSPGARGGQPTARLRPAGGATAKLDPGDNPVAEGPDPFSITSVGMPALNVPPPPPPRPVSGADPPSAPAAAPFPSPVTAEAFPSPPTAQRASPRSSRAPLLGLLIAGGLLGAVVFLVWFLQSRQRNVESNTPPAPIPAQPAPQPPNPQPEVLPSPPTPNPLDNTLAGRIATMASRIGDLEVRSVALKAAQQPEAKRRIDAVKAKLEAARARAAESPVEAASACDALEHELDALTLELFPEPVAPLNADGR